MAATELLSTPVLQVEAAPAQSALNSRVLLSRFRWLDKWMLYVVCVRFAPAHKLRSHCCRVWYSILNTFVFISFLIYLFLKMSFEIIPKYDHKHVVYWISVIVFEIMFLVIKSLSFWYYHHYFNYPWYAKRAQLNSEHKVRYRDHRDAYNVGCVGRRFKLVLYTFIVIKIILCFAQLYVRINASTEEYKDFAVGYVAFDWLFYVLYILVLIAVEIFYNIQFLFVLIVQSAICYKYHWYLLQIINNFESMDLSALHLQYQDVYAEWKKDYNVYLKWTIQVAIISIVMTAWTDIYRFEITDPVDVLEDILLISLYFISAGLLCDTFDEFQRLLWDKVDHCIGNEERAMEAQRLNVLIAYTDRFPLRIEFGGISVSKKNTAVFVLAFIAARYDAPLPNNYVESHT